MNENVYAIPGLITPTYGFPKQEDMLNAIQMQSLGAQYFRNCVARKMCQRRMQILQLCQKRLQVLQTRQEKNQPPLISQKQIIWNNSIVCESTAALSTIINSYQRDYKYSAIINDCPQWPTPLIVGPSISIVIPTPIITPLVTPIVGPDIQPILAPVLPPILPEIPHEQVINVSMCTNVNTDSADLYESIVVSPHEQTHYHEQEEISIKTVMSTVEANAEVQANHCLDIEYYLKLPKDKFPSPRMLKFDPNIIIDELCKISNIQRHVPWILDLEFGVPRIPVARPVAEYNILYNNIFCKDTLNVIHPDFESCDRDFKSVLLLYYDCVVSAWYRGYTMMYGHDSVDNFQSWIQLPMQVLGMSWS